MMTTRNLLHGIPLGVLLLTSGGLSALSGPPLPFLSAINPKQLEREVMHQIDRHVIYPLDDDEGAMYGVVEVAFAVNVDGRIVVKEARPGNKALHDHVIRKLRKVPVGLNPTGPWNTTHVRSVFRPERGSL